MTVVSINIFQTLHFMNKIKTYPFTQPFIQNLITYIDEHYVIKGRDLSKIAIVFGGKRPALFVKRELGLRLKKSFVPPKFFTIDEFVATTIKKKELFQSGQDLDQCFMLYELAQKHTPHILEGRETFAQFLPWTREILAFIDQLDLEHVEETQLKNIEANAQIGYPVPDDINRLLESIVVLRQLYHESMRGAQVYSRGMQYLRASELIDQVEFEEYDEILFCNFFYFNRSEERLVKHLYEKGKAVLLFQGDQRKWPVLERIARNFDCSLVEGDESEPTNFDLKLYAGFDAHSQVGLVREILNKTKSLDLTVIVLPNPNLIMPLLSEVTTLAEEFNISMGYPLKRSSLYTLFEFVFSAQRSKKGRRYYAKDYLKALRHPFIKNLTFTSKSTTTRILIHKIEEILIGKEMTEISGSLFVDLNDIENLDDLYRLTEEMLTRLNIDTSREELEGVLKNIHGLLFRGWEVVTNFQSFAQRLGEFLDVLVDKSFLSNYPLNVNIASKMYAIRDEFLKVTFHNEEFPQDEIFRIFDSKISREIVAFIGSPLKGLQILGLFETRSLNFDNVICLDVNEGALPRLNIYEPLIPREVMISLNLDRLELEEEIQRYQFMRLISSAKNVHLVYQESKDKEKSRFVEELIWEKQKKAEKMDTIPVTAASFSVRVEAKRRFVQKTPQILEMLRQHVYSASSINTYVRNPMEFYQNYVLGLREQEDLLDEPEARHVGTFVHELLEEQFQPFLKKEPKIDEAFIKRFAKRFDQRFEGTFGRSMKSDSFLLKSVLTERMARFLENEQTSVERQGLKILYLESKFDDEIPLSCGDVKFRYIVDRVDRLKDGTIMIVDYKTGSVDVMPRAIERIEVMDLSRETIKENVKSFQVPLYYYYLNKQFPDDPINAALYNLRTLKIDKFITDRMKFDRDRINKTFLRALDFIMKEILDPEVDFVEDLSK